MAKNKMISLAYTFLFDQNTNIWNSVYDFERDLSDFFSAHQLEAEAVNVLQGSGGNRMMFIKKMEDIDKLLNRPQAETMRQQLPTPGKAQSSAAIVKNLTNSIGKGRRT